tara:strand:- start:6 stop:1904 length:1899 start_codon:yes stop_codon:yes gene_type:complete
MKKTYRSEIDGLRSLAIIGVLFYHAEIVFDSYRIFPGGFLGVDIFFVISGYLITTLILKEYQLKNSFSFKNFYKRRVKRLLPSLLIVVIVSSIFSYFLLLPIHFVEFIKSVVASFFFFSNIFFHYSGQAYGVQVLSEIPLLHSWSLSLEEQFYILYPIFLVGIFIFIKKKLKLILILGIILSIIFATITNINHQSFNFYMLPSRVWELLFGALLGANIPNINIKKNEKIKEILGFLGFVIILYSFSFFDNTNNHPTYLTLVPVIGAYLVIQDNNNKSFTNRFLSVKPLVGLGLISYSLYLWHHPIFSFAKIIGVEKEDFLIKVWLIIVSILLATLTYRYVEKTFRGNNEKIYRFNKINVLATITIITISFLYSLVDYQKKQYPVIAHQIDEKTWYVTKKYFRPCFQRKTFFCSFNEKKNNNTIFLIGDSIMASLQEEIQNISIKKDLNFISMTNAGCDFLKIYQKSKKCSKKIFDNRNKKILEKKESTIILHINYGNKINDETLNDFSKRVYQYLDKNYKIILIYPIPQMNQHVSAEVKKDIANDIVPIKLVNIKLSNYLKESKKIFSFFDSLNHKNLYKVYPHEKFCDSYLKDKCIGNTQNHLYFIDTAHLSRKGSRLIGVDLIKIIDNIY